MSNKTGRNGANPALAAQDEGADMLPQAISHAMNKKLTNICNKDICPVCKSSRYLNPNMRFLVNPECYHKMCESCVDRIFSQGPAPCPVAGCARTLRKQRFRRQTFEDLMIEREVDIRRRVAEVFNRRQEEFLDLRAYNDYLEKVENLTFNLVNNIDVKETEAMLAAYAAQNKGSIAQNAVREDKEHSNAEAQLAADKETARVRREESVREDEEERKGRLEADRVAQERIARGANPPREMQKVVLKKSTARRKGAEKATLAGEDNGAPTATFEIQGLKPVVAPEPKRAYDAFGGLIIKPEYYTLQKRYEHPWLDKARTDPAITTGGYDVGEYCARAIMEAFAGLGVFVDQEIGPREGHIKGRWY
ncbi:MAG: hypothetical protein Q9163_002138 [Psora crenata]